MNKEIVIVSAFFDINRETFEIHQRNDNQYMEYFKFWASIKNKVIIYCDPKNCQRIYSIRDDFGLADRTRIICIEDIFSLEPEIYQQMCIISNNEDFRNSRFFKTALSNRADYDYVMLLKYWCLNDAANFFSEDVTYAWVDFGFNHGGKYYTDPKDFSFLWEYKFEDLITIFCLSHPDNILGIDSLQFQKDCITGSPIIVSSKYVKPFWDSIRLSMLSLISIDCIDDDQQLLLMVYKLHKEWFKVIVCDWFEGIELCSSKQFATIKNIANSDDSNVINNSNKEQLVKSQKPLYKRMVQKFNSIKDKHSRKNNSQKHELTESQRFAERMYQKASKYYGP